MGNAVILWCVGRFSFAIELNWDRLSRGIHLGFASFYTIILYPPENKSYLRAFIAYINFIDTKIGMRYSSKRYSHSFCTCTYFCFLTPSLRGRKALRNRLEMSWVDLNVCILSPSEKSSESWKGDVVKHEKLCMLPNSQSSSSYLFHPETKHFFNHGCNQLHTL